MKAYNLHGIGDFRYEDVDKPVADDDSVIVRVRAAGICGSDIPRVYTNGTYHFPTIPGHEFSGEIEDNGKRVGIFPLIPCQSCPSCKKKQYEMCTNYNYLGSRTDGGFAEYVKVPKWNLIELPDTVTFEQAAMLEPMAVAVHAIRQSKVKPGDSVAVCGLGTIGLLIVMFLRDMGIETVLGLGNKEFQKQSLLKMGVADECYCDTKTAEPVGWILSKTDGQGVDVFFECVGKNETVNTAIESVCAAGSVQLVGNPASDMNLPKNVFWRILRKQLNVYGTWNSSYTHSESDDWHYVLDRLSTQRVHPESLITHRYDMASIGEGFSVMKDKSEDYIKIMMLN